MSHREVLRHASLYYLTGTALSSVYTYASNPDHFQAAYNKALTDAPLLDTAFKYNIAFWSKKLMEQVGNLVRYKCEYIAQIITSTLYADRARHSPYFRRAFSSLG